MPTPFTHLRIAQDLLVDSRLPCQYRALLQRHLPAFQLGGIVADARVASGVGREATHFYAYGQPIVEHPWRLMLRQHPRLCAPLDPTHLVFLAGYVAHLAVDECWALRMARPRFWEADWGGVSRRDKFFALHLILTVMDERDEKALCDWQAASLRRAQPQGWLPFMTDALLCQWRDLVARQIEPDGCSSTLDIFAGRLGMDPLQIRRALDDPDAMERHLWRYVPRDLLSNVEARMVAFAREQTAIYLKEFLPCTAAG